MSPERMPSPSTYDPCALSCFRSHLPSSVGPSCLHGSVLTPGEVSVRQGECTEAELASMIRHGMPAVGGPHSCWRRGPDDQPQVIAVDLHRSVLQTSLTDEIQHETWEKSRISTHDMRG
jgi:hypothetical protein